MRRTLNHVSRIRCKDVAVSFARRRAELVTQAENDGAKTLVDNGTFFHAERFNCSGERVVYMACEQGAPFVNGPAIIRTHGAVEYADLLLPK